MVSMTGNGYTSAGKRGSVYLAYDIIHAWHEREQEHIAGQKYANHPGADIFLHPAKL